MKNNFIIRYFDGDAEPRSGGGIGGIGSAIGGNPYAQVAQEGIGAIQSIIGFINAKKAEKQLSKLPSPTYVKNQSILDYYDKALARYGVNPQDSALYKRQAQNIARNTAQGASFLQDRRAGQAGVSGLIKGQNDASLNAEVAAENQRNQRFGELGSATGMKANEDRMAFQYNEQAPFERKYNLLSMKAGAGAGLANAGLSNIFSGLNTQQQLDMIKKTYG